jgi:hypothetical protein
MWITEQLLIPFHLVLSPKPLSVYLSLLVFSVNVFRVGLGGLVISVLAIGTMVRGLRPGEERWTSKCDKNPQHDFLRRGSKAVGPVS